MNVKVNEINSLQVLIMIYFCNCLKSKKRKESEKCLKSAINQVFKTYDATNIVNTCQKMKLFKEIVFEDHQKVLFEHLLKPIVLGNQVRSAYDYDFIENLSINEEEVALTNVQIKPFDGLQIQSP